ncbi:MAG TPA: hypothetical protein VG389_29720 [Myxococcota bacterium]|jgi:hypothetical protein|nr:hypothetical protein [Myxococcota bacterium]
MPGRKRLVLVVEGNERAGRETQHRLEGELGGDVRIVAALGADEALAVVQAWPPHVAVIRVDAWEGGAARLCEAMRQCGRRMGVLALRGGELAAVADVKRALREACPQETWMRALGREADPHGRHPFAVAFRLLCLPDKTTARMEGVSVAAIKAFRARIGGVPMQGRSWSERLAWVVARLEARRASGNSAGGGGLFARAGARPCARGAHVTAPG